MIVSLEAKIGVDLAELVLKDVPSLHKQQRLAAPSTAITAAMVI